MLETIGAQLAMLCTQVADIDQRMAKVETDRAASASPSRPVQVQLSPETVAQIADALAGLQAASSQAVDEAFKTASDDLTEALSDLVRAEISRTLRDAGYTVEVSQAAEARAAEISEVVEHPEPADDGAVIASASTADLGGDAAGIDGTDADRAPLSLSDLDDPFLDALVRKAPLTA